MITEKNTCPYSAVTKTTFFYFDPPSSK